MSAFNQHRVHFQTSSNQSSLTSRPPWSERYIKLSKLFNALTTNSIHVNLNHHLINSSHHLNLIHHQINQQQEQEHDLNSKLGSLIEISNKLLNKNSKIQTYQLSLNEIKLLKRVIHSQFDPILDFVKIRELSSSECGKVELVKSKLSKDENRNQRNLYVLKTIYKSAAIRMREHISVDIELSILQLSRSSKTNQTLKTKGILPNLLASFQSNDSLYILTSYISGGTLSDLINKRKNSKLNLIKDFKYEQIIKQWIIEIIIGLNWLHTIHFWVHRDLKPSNVLLNLNGHIILNDFGTAAPLIKFNPPLIDQYHWEKFNQELVYEFPKLLVPKTFSRTLVGTCDYIAPEVLHSHLHTVMDLMDHDSESTISDDHNDHKVAGLYGNEVDWWSLGITLYELLYGTLPFYSSSISSTYEMIVSHQNFLSFPNSSPMIPTCNVSFDAKDFIKSLLTDPYKRLGSDSTGVKQIQNHNWFKGIDWSNIRTTEPLFKPTDETLEFEIESDEISLGIPGSSEPGKVTTGFNFSAFFASSPGLSVLRSIKKPQPNHQTKSKQSEDEEEEEEEEARKTQDEIFNGFTLLPNLINEFEIDEEIGMINLKKKDEKKLKSSLSSGMNHRIELIQDGFITPIRPKLIKNSTGTGTGTGTGMSKTARGMSGLEEWKELVDLVTMTAQKKKMKKELKENERNRLNDQNGIRNLKFKESKVIELNENQKKKPSKEEKEEENQIKLNGNQIFESNQIEINCEELMKKTNEIIQKYENLFKFLEDEDYK